jgi:hypothetical protein
MQAMKLVVEKSEDRNIEYLPRFVQGRIGRIERDESVIALIAFCRLALEYIVDDVREIDRLEKTELLAQAAFARPVYFDLRFRIRHGLQMLLECHVEIGIAIAR